MVAHEPAQRAVDAHASPGSARAAAAVDATLAVDAAPAVAAARTVDTTPAGPAADASTPVAATGAHGPTRRLAAAPDTAADGLARLVAGLTTRQRDVLLAVGVAAMALVFHVGLRGPGDGLTAGWVGAALLVVMSGSLVWRRHHRDLTTSVAGAAIMLYHLGGAESPAAVIVFLFALYAAAAFSPDRREGLVVLAVSVAFMTLSFALEGGRAAVVSVDYLLSLFTFLVAWSLGDGTRARTALALELRARAEQVDALRRREQAMLVAGERRRIARELHDVVSHTVAVVVVQAGAARRVLDVDPAAAAEALATIEGTGRDAMVELRRMLGVLRDDAGAGLDDGTVPVPDLASVATLVATLRAAGLPVELHGELDVELPAGVALTVHRVVQEGLTNVLRHAEDVGTVVVGLRHAPGRVLVEVTDDGRPVRRAAGASAGAGAGLVGLRERVALHGGSIVAGPRDDGRGHRLRADVPLGSAT